MKQQSIDSTHRVQHSSLLGAQAEPLPFVTPSIEQLQLTEAQLDLWNSLAAGADSPDPLSCGAAWQKTALRCSRRFGDPIVFRQSDNSQISFTMTAERSGIRLGALEGHWKFGSPLLGPGSVQLLSDTLEAVRLAIPGIPLAVEVPGLGLNSRLLSQIEERFGVIRISSQDTHAAASLAGGIDAWKSRRSSNYRRLLGRAKKRGSSHGISFQRLQPKSTVEAHKAFYRMLQVERQSWKGAHATGLFDLPRFYEQLLCEYAKSGMAMVIFARLADRDVGFCMGGVSGGIYRGQQTSYTTDVSQFSVGHLMHYETTKWLCEKGATLQHFGPVQRQLEYKNRLCELKVESRAVQFLVT